jgi:SAM-dependent methyltransferase
METSRSGAAVQPGNRPHFYYDQSRPEVADLVPGECQRILEIGCATGQLGCLLKTRGHHVTGVELVPEVAEAAREHLDHVVTADVETDGFPFDSDSFDCIIFADVLEHLIDPWRVLREAVAVLAPDGCVIASIPNVQNIDVVWRLLRGRWDYRERGITDFGHLRFFTLRTIHGLFEEAGLEIVHVGYKYRRSWWRAVMCWLTLSKAREFYTRQYLVVGRRRYDSR